MNLFFQIALFLIFGFIAAFFAVFFRKKKRCDPALTRKIFHIIIFTGAAYVLTYLDQTALFIYGFTIVAIILTAVLIFKKTNLAEALVRSRDKSKQRSSVLIPLTATALGGTLSLLLFEQYALVGILISGWGDGLAEPVGSQWGKHRIYLTGRTLEGSLAFLGGAVLALILAFDLLNIAILTQLIPALLIVFSATLIEAISPGGTDNFTVQVGASGVAFLLINNSI